MGKKKCDWRAEWQRERRAEIKEQIRDDKRDAREFARDIKRYGTEKEVRGAEIVGWRIRIGPHCIESKHLNGTLIPIADIDAKKWDLLPPYSTCDPETCECEIDPVDVADLQRKTKDSAMGEKQNTLAGYCVAFLIILIIILVMVLF